MFQQGAWVYVGNSSGFLCSLQMGCPQRIRIELKNPYPKSAKTKVSSYSSALESLTLTPPAHLSAEEQPELCRRQGCVEGSRTASPGGANEGGPGGSRSHLWPKLCLPPAAYLEP